MLLFFSQNPRPIAPTRWVEPLLGRLSGRFCALLLLGLALPCLTPRTVQAQEEPTETEYRTRREEMVRLFIKGAGITNERVIQSMLDTPRHEFVPKKDR